MRTRLRQRLRRQGVHQVEIEIIEVRLRDVDRAARFIAIRDKNTILVGLCDELIGELREDIARVARNRDKNSPPRVVDERRANRYGRYRR